MKIDVAPGGVIDVQAVASGSGPVVFSLQGPSWLSIGSTSGRITGTVPQDQPPGTVTVTVIAQNCFVDGVAQYESRQELEIVVASGCVAVKIYDSGLANCVPASIVAPTVTNTIVRGQVTTSFSFRILGDTSSVHPKIVWTLTAGAVVSKTNDDNDTYRLIVASEDLQDGTYDYHVYAANCGSPMSNAQQTFRVVVGSGVAGPPSGGGSNPSGCTVQISAPGSHPIDQPLNVQLTTASGGTCSAWQTWFLNESEPGSAAGTGTAPGQQIPDSPSPGNYIFNVSGMAPGVYKLWGKCNDGSSCQDAWVVRPIQLTAAGTPPSTGGPGTGGECKKPAIVPITPAQFTVPAGSGVSFEMHLTADSPLQGTSVQAFVIGGTGGQVFLSWIEGRRYFVTARMNADATVGQALTFALRASNPCGVGEHVMTMTATAGTSPPPGTPPPPPPAGCVPANATQPPSTTLTGATLATASTTLTVSGTEPITVSTPSHRNVAINRSGNVVTLTGTFSAVMNDSVPVQVSNPCGSVTRVWAIQASGQGGA